MYAISEQEARSEQISVILVEEASGEKITFIIYRDYLWFPVEFTPDTPSSISNKALKKGLNR